MRHERPTIATARTIYRVATYEAYVLAHATALATLRETEGAIVTTHADLEPRIARINYGRWLTDCACGAGVAVDSTFPDARCFFCGAVMSVVFPPLEEREAIEVLLLRRPLENRHWRPYESVVDVARLNAAHGVGGCDAVDR